MALAIAAVAALEIFQLHLLLPLENRLLDRFVRAQASRLARTRTSCWSTSTRRASP